MSNYLLKYKGTYRLLPTLDKTTNDLVRNADGSIEDIDIFIDCQNGNKIFFYGHDTNKRVILFAYIPSVGRGRNVKKALDEQGIAYTDYSETDAEVEFRFKAKDIEPIAKLLKAKTAGANISPFSIKNLPRSKNVQIPYGEIARYKEITNKVLKKTCS